MNEKNTGNNAGIAPTDQPEDDLVGRTGTVQSVNQDGTLAVKLEDGRIIVGVIDGTKGDRK